MILLKNNLIKEKVSVKDKNTLKIGKRVLFYCEPGNVDEILQAVDFAEKKGVKFFILGGGSNILFPDEDVEVLAISLKKFNEISVFGDKVIAGAGSKLSQVLNVMRENSLAGLEFVAGIPATIGGAVRMNLGSMGYEIFNFIDELFVYEKGWFRRIRKDEINYSYRKGYIEGIVIYASFILRKENKGLIDKRIREILSKKKRTQPLHLPSAGCVFKNPSFDKPAGWLIEKVGLKGYRIGGAMFSDVHANFIVNIGNATANDVYSLIELAKEKVRKKFDIELKRELIFLKEDILYER